MTTAYTSLLGLALPVQGELQGTWGDTVNNSITSLLDTAVAGTTTISTDGDVTLTTTTGAANQSRQAILLCSGARTAARNITAPAQSKIYTVINATTGGYAVTIRGVGPTTGISIPAGQTAQVAWNGSDFVDASNYTNGNKYINGTLTVVGAATLQSTLSVTGAGTIQGLTVGKGAGAVSTNTAVGASALALNSTGSINTAVGANSMSNGVVTGTYNSGLGFGSLYSVTTGSGNTATGASALQYTTTGASNTASGVQALYNNTTASNNTAVGYQALYSSATGASQTAIGRKAGYAKTTADTVYGSTFIGDLCGSSTTTGIENTLVGAASGLLNTSGSYNVALGGGALYSNTTASQNTAVGYQAGYSVTTNSNNVYVGRQAGYLNTGSLNTGIGDGTLYSSGAGSRNTALGQAALQSLTSGNYNTSVGQESLVNNTTASNNTAVGYQAGYSNTTGTYNTFLGHQAGYNVTTGSYNTIVGRYDGNTGGPDIRTANNYIILSDGSGTARAYWNGSGTLFNAGSSYFGAAVSGVPAANAGFGGESFWHGNGSNGALFYTSGSAGTGTAVECTRQNDGAGIYFFRNGSAAGFINITTGAISLNNSSDYRLKENVETLSGSLAKVMQVRPVTFTWKENGTVGKSVIAHELQEIFPDVVFGEKDAFNEDGSIKPQSVALGNLVPDLIAAIQELKAEFDAYKEAHP